jgi:hypothetical protein
LATSSPEHELRRVAVLVAAHPGSGLAESAAWVPEDELDVLLDTALDQQVVVVAPDAVVDDSSGFSK